MGILRIRRPTGYTEEVGGPLPRDVLTGAIEQTIRGPLTAGGAVAIATEPGDVVDVAGTVSVSGPVAVTGTVAVSSVAGLVDVSGSTVVASGTVAVSSVAGLVDVTGSGVNARDGLGNPLTSVAAGARRPLEVLELDGTGAQNPLKRTRLQTPAGVDLTTSSAGGVVSLDSTVHDAAGNRIGSSVASAVRGLRTFQVNQAAGVVTFTAIADRLGGGQGLEVLPITSTVYPVGAGMAVVDTVSRGRIADATTLSRYAGVLAGRGVEPVGGDNPLFVKSDRVRWEGSLNTTNVTASGNTTLLGALGGTAFAIRKIHARLEAAGAARSVAFRFGAAGTMHFRGDVSAKMVLEIDLEADRVWLGAVNTAFICNLSGASDLYVTIVYDIRPVAV